MAVSKSGTRIGRRTSGRAWRLFVGAIICCGVAGMLAVVLLAFGRVSGIEFSPTHFQSRRFTVHEIPWVQIQISPIRRTNLQSSTTRYLIAQSYIQPAKGLPTRWDLVELTRGIATYFDADAKLLTDQLDLSVFSQSGAKGYWHDWSTQNPAQAKVLWPTIQKLAVRELYILMPRLFSLALDAADEKALQESIDGYLRASYRDLIVEMRAAGRLELANELLAEAIVDYPDDRQLQALR